MQFMIRRATGSTSEPPCERAYLVRTEQHGPFANGVSYVEHHYAIEVPTLWDLESLGKLVKEPLIVQFNRGTPEITIYDGYIE